MCAPLLFFQQCHGSLGALWPWGMETVTSLFCWNGWKSWEQLNKRSGLVRPWGSSSNASLRKNSRRRYLWLLDVSKGFHEILWRGWVLHNCMGKSQPSQKIKTSHRRPAMRCIQCLPCQCAVPPLGLCTQAHQSSQNLHGVTVNSPWEPENPAWILVSLVKHLGDGGGRAGHRSYWFRRSLNILSMSNELQKVKDPKFSSNPNSAFLSPDSG